MLLEERQRALPGVLRRRLVVRAPCVAVEAVVGVRVPDDLGVVGRLGRGGAERVDLVARDATVEVADAPVR